MERLTWTCRADGYDDVGLRDGVTIGGAICRLAAYEDTGLDPEEVTELMAAHGTAILELSEYRSIGIEKHLFELAQAEKDGRLMVLPSDDYIWQIRGDLFLSIIRANCRAAREEAEAALKKREEADNAKD